MSLISGIHGMGWLPDYPDFRDYSTDTEQIHARIQRLGKKDSVKSMLAKVGVTEPKVNLLSSVDLRNWCSPIEDQGSLGSCTANAGAGVVEYFENRAFGKYLNVSRLFLYKVTRDLIHQKGDSGAYLRNTMGALALFGVPPEEYWPYKIAYYDMEPSAFCYAFAQNYQALTYYRLDPHGTSSDVVLNRIKTNLAAGLPSMFGFTVYSSISQADSSGEIPFPTPSERSEGGHAIVAVGYDDKKKIENTNPGAKETTGALLIRNSWGTSWGLKGYGWLPYDYVTKGVAVDWWSLLKNDWIDTGEFKIR